MLKLFGIPYDNCLGFKVTAAQDQLVDVEVKYILNLNSDTLEFQKIINKYKLVEKNNGNYSKSNH